MCAHTGKKVLKPNAVPTIFKLSEHVPKKASEQDIQRIRKRQEVCVADN